MKKLTTLLPGALLAFSAATVAADNSNQYAAMHKQLNIMTNIMKSSIVDDNGRTKVRSIEATYLKGQGAVFTMSTDGFNRFFGGLSFVAPPEPVAVSVSAPSVTIEAEEMTFRAQEWAERSLYENREVMRDLADAKRDTAYEVRDVQRALRDVEYQLKRADAEAKKSLANEKKQLVERQAKIEGELKELEAKAKEFEAKRKQEVARQEEKRVKNNAALSEGLADVMCLYGNGLRALPKGEKITLILKNAGEKQSRSYKDIIYVFESKDIASCATDKITSKQLLSKAHGYQF